MSTEAQAFIRNSVNVTPSGCWEWLGYVDPCGYARYSGRYAHRTAYRAFKGPVPKSLEIHHECRNKRCVNPNHLGAVSRKSHNRMGGNCKITMQQAEEIRRKYKPWLYTQAQLGVEFGVSEGHISRIISRELWI